MNDPYRQGAPHQTHVQYQGMPPGYHPQQQVPPYADHYNPPSQEPRRVMQTEGGTLATLVPGIQPSVPEPMPKSCTDNGRKYELVVVQQPRRARMCGFGDKDRRPITPPPCVRLVITDIITGKEVDCNDIDHGMFVLNVDLWSMSGSGEVNLVRHTTSSPSISNTTTVSYQETKPIYATIVPQQVVKYESNHGPPQGQPPYNPYPQNGPPQVTPYMQGPPQNGQYQQGYGPSNGQPQYAHSGYQGQGHTGNIPSPPEYVNGQQAARNQTQQPQGMFTRNLIGSLAASAFRLTDTDDRIGIWFVLQDLSVRTEGHFRLRFSFVNVGAAMTPTSIPNPADRANGLHTAPINTGKAPILAACFSEVFTVYSAKKFPGVVESTPLSKCFATQGIKIPIRKDGPGNEKGGKKGGDFEDDD